LFFSSFEINICQIVKQKTFKTFLLLTKYSKVSIQINNSAFNLCIYDKANNL
jgi:hypothetical protein